MSEQVPTKDLLHCPFCGAPPECCGAFPIGLDKDCEWEIRCDNSEGCGASMIAANREQVIEFWNRRAAEPMEIRHVG